MFKTHVLPPLVVLTALIAAAWPGGALAATTPRLGTALNFAVLAGSTITNTGPTVIVSDLGLDAGSAVTGFPPGVVVGAKHIADAVALRAKNDLVTAYNDAATSPSTSDMTGQDLAGKNLTPGVYTFSSSAQLSGPLTLSGNGVFIFKIGSSLTTASNSVVLLTHGAQACGVYWQVGSSATLGSATQFQGNLMALTSITMVTGANILTGRALARNGALTLDSNRITPPIGPCTVAQGPTPTPSAGATPTPSTGATPTPQPGSTPSAGTPSTLGPGPIDSLGPGRGSSASAGTELPAQSGPAIGLPQTGGAAPEQPGLPWWPLAIAVAVGTVLLSLLRRMLGRDL